MPLPSAAMDGSYYNMGPRKTEGTWARLREMFAWKYRWQDDAFNYYENEITGDRKATPRKGITKRDAQPDHKWMAAVR